MGNLASRHELRRPFDLNILTRLRAFVIFKQNQLVVNVSREILFLSIDQPPKVNAELTGSSDIDSQLSGGIQIVEENLQIHHLK